MDHEKTPEDTPIVVNKHSNFEKELYNQAKTPVKSHTGDDFKSQLQDDEQLSKKDEPSQKQEETDKTEKDKEEQPTEKKKQKMIITGDDILIEYVNRIIRHLESTCNIFFKKYN